MKGIGKRVTIGFLSIVVLLLVSGVISIVELSNLSYDTKVILDAGGEDITMAKGLLQSSHDHSRAVLDLVIFEDSTSLAKRDKAIADIAEQIHLLKGEETNTTLRGCIDTLSDCAAKLERVTKNYELQKQKHAALTGRVWYSKIYEPAYNDLTEQIKHYMKLSHGELAPRAEQLSRNAYRAITPVMISLLVMIAVVLMLYYFVYIYSVKPILKINKALSDYLTFKLPFTVKAQLIDQLKELHDNIDALITSSKSNK
ncbi:MAG: hypothetical protein IKL60_05005 [Alistipes sp.]|nr:hypothetical protein [Alistipes sp.]